MRQKINGQSPFEMIATMSEGNPGALSVLAQLAEDGEDNGFMKMLGLDDMNIRGQQIWVGYKDHCKEDLETFKQAIHVRDEDMVHTINQNCMYPGFTEEAVASGASFGR